MCPKSVVPRCMRQFLEIHKIIKTRDNPSYSFPNWQAWVSWIIALLIYSRQSSSYFPKIMLSPVIRTTFPSSTLVPYQVNLKARPISKISSGTRFRIQPCLYHFSSHSSRYHNIRTLLLAALITPLSITCSQIKILLHSKAPISNSLMRTSFRHWNNYMLSWNKRLQIQCSQKFSNTQSSLQVPLWYNWDSMEGHLLSTIALFAILHQLSYSKLKTSSFNSDTNRFQIIQFPWDKKL